MLPFFGTRPQPYSPWHLTLRAWPLQVAGDRLALIWAVALFAGGLIALTVLGERRE